MRQDELLALGLKGKIAAYSFDHWVEREGFLTERDHAGVETRDIEQGAEKRVERFNRTGNLFKQSSAARIERSFPQRADKHRECMHGLSQIVARGGEKS